MSAWMADEAARPIKRRIIDTIEKQFDIRKSAAWKDLKKLSAETTVDGLQAEPAGILVAPDGASFEGVANVFVRLSYDEADGRKGTIADGFVADVRGRVDADTVTIDDVKVDTRRTDD